MADLSVISSSTVVRGNIQGDASLRIDGRVRGDIAVTGDVLIGPSAQIAGSVTGANISVAGAVEGDITGSGALLLEKTARVVGNLAAPRIGVADGALVRGNLQTDASAQPVAPSTSFSARAASPARGATRTAEARPPARTERRPEPVRSVEARSVEARSVEARSVETRSVEPVRVPARPQTKTAPAAAPVAPPLNLEVQEVTRGVEAASKIERKAPPPPVVSAPGKQAKGRKKAAKRSPG